MSIPTPDQSNTGAVQGQTPPTSAKPGTDAPGLVQAVGGMLTPLMVMMQEHAAQEKGVGGVGGVSASQDQTTVAQANDDSKRLSGAYDGVSLQNPQLPTTNQANVEEGMEHLVNSIVNGENPFTGNTVSPGLLNAVLSNNQQSSRQGGIDGAEGAGGTGDTSLVQKAKAAVNDLTGGSPVQKIKALAFLGGLTAVALFTVLSQFAKVQSDTAKMANTADLSLQKADIENAKDQAQITLQEAAVAIAALVTQMVVGVAAAGIQIGGSMAAMKAVQGGMSSEEANIMNSMYTATSQILSTVGEKGADIIKTALTAPLEAQKILLQAYQQIIQKAEQGMGKMQDDENALVGQALDLLKQMLGAMMQSFSKFGH